MASCGSRKWKSMIHALDSVLGVWAVTNCHRRVLPGAPKSNVVYLSSRLTAP